MILIVGMFFVSLPAVFLVEYLLVFFCERNEVLQVRLKLNWMYLICIDLAKLPRPVYGSIRNTNKVVSNELRQSFWEYHGLTYYFLGSYPMLHMAHMLLVR